jgi:hypothetical protein
MLKFRGGWENSGVDGLKFRGEWKNSWVDGKIQGWMGKRPKVARYPIHYKPKQPLQFILVILNQNCFAEMFVYRYSTNP